jgi:BED zinc finger
MASKADSSLLAPSTTQVSILSGSKPSKNQSTSAVWDHCRTAHGTEKKENKYCRYCKEDSKDLVYSTTNSQNMYMHIKRKHQIDIKLSLSRVQIAALHQLKELYRQAESSS